MKLEKNEYTTNSLISFLTKKFGTKFTGQEFNHSDIAQYCIRGFIPYKYGGQKITVKHEDGLKIIVLSEEIQRVVPKTSSKSKKK